MLPQGTNLHLLLVKQLIKTIFFISFFCGAQFSFAQPSNDNFSNAINVTSLINSCSVDAAYTTVNATPDLNGGSQWAAPNAKSNVWFRFVGPVNGNINIVVGIEGTQGTQEYSQLALWEADGVTEIASENWYKKKDDVDLGHVGLTPGATYYISVDSDSAISTGTFTLCLSDTLDYDFYEGAVDITAYLNSCSANSAYTTNGATPDKNRGNNGSSGGPFKNRWFRFLAPASGFINITVNVGGGSGNPLGTQRFTELALWEADGLTELASNRYISSNDNVALNYYGLTPGSLYYFSVDSSTGWGTFTLCMDSLTNSDVDGDNVSNYIDLDDDNDGILDTVEGCQNTDIAGTIGIGNNVTNNTYPIIGTDLTYTLNNPDNVQIYGYDAGLNGMGIRIQGDAGEAGSLTSEYSTPIANVFFKMTDFDHNTRCTINVYDENNVLYDLSVEGLVSVGSIITRSGNYFEASGTDSDGNDPADDPIGSILLYFESQVSRIELNFEYPSNSSTRFIQPTFCILDTDGDGLTDHKDLDSDGDGIPDNVEAQTTLGYIAPNSDDALTYANNQGVNSAYLGGLNPTNTDGTDVPDYQDTDSDNEGGTDTLEAQITLLNTDSDTDGLDDSTDATPDYSDVGGTIDDPLSGAIILLDTDKDANFGGDVDFRDGQDDRRDTDADGIADAIDLDDDNDGILDSEELSVTIGNTQPNCTGETILDFSTPPTLESGTVLQEGAVYRFPNVNTGTDVLLTITETFNASVADIDNNSQEIQAFRPRTAFDISNVGKEGYIEYRMQFVNSGGTTPVIVPKFFLNINDTDGNVDYSEEIYVDNPSSYIISNPTELSVSYEYPWVVATGGVTEYPGAGNTFPQINFGINYENRSEISFRTGITAIIPAVAASGREHNLDFRCTTNYINPEIYVLDIDKDGLPNPVDLDSDNDGIYDVIEAGHGQSYTSGRVIGTVGADGVPDVVQTDPDSGSVNYIIAESVEDTDTIPHYVDLDADGDGLPDNVEAQTTIGYIVPTTVVDSNGVDLAYVSGLDPVNTDGADNPDYLDTDSDNDGSNDITEAALTLSGNDTDIDGLDDAVDADTSGYDDAGGTIDNPLVAPEILPDTDNDATIGGDVDFRDVPDSEIVDIDSDDDGILDTMEDLNLDGDDDPTTNPTNSDNDLIPDYLDIDSDDDGIPDNVEAQTTSGYIPPSLVDANDNGLDDAYESGLELGLIPENTDNADVPDYIDDDSDNDNVPDNIEGHDYNHDGIPDLVLIGSDKDNDGLDDNFEGIEQIDIDVNDKIDNPATDLPNTDGDSELDYRDIDDDDDGILTEAEDENGDDDYANDDFDYDGTPDYLDPDQPIRYEDVEVFNVITPNGDGAHDFLMITGLDVRPDNTINIYNRWGILVYATASYDITNNRFVGTSQARATYKAGELLPTGTYYYILNYVDVNDSNKTLSGHIYLN